MFVKLSVKLSDSWLEFTPLIWSAAGLYARSITVNIFWLSLYSEIWNFVSFMPEKICLFITKNESYIALKKSDLKSGQQNKAVNIR